MVGASGTGGLTRSCADCVSVGLPVCQCVCSWGVLRGHMLSQPSAYLHCMEHPACWNQAVGASDACLSMPGTRRPTRPGPEVTHHLAEGSFEEGGMVGMQGVHGTLHFGQQTTCPLDASCNRGCPFRQRGISLCSTTCLTAFEMTGTTLERTWTPCASGRFACAAPDSQPAGQCTWVFRVAPPAASGAPVCCCACQHQQVSHLASLIVSTSKHALLPVGNLHGQHNMTDGLCD